MIRKTFIAIVITSFCFYIGFNFDNLVTVSANEIYSVNSYYFNDELVATISNEDSEVLSTVGSKKPAEDENTEIVENPSLLNIGPSKTAEELTDVDTEYEAGYKIKIGSNEYFVNDKEIFENSYEKILKYYLKNEKAYEQYLNFGDFEPFQVEEKTYTDFELIDDLTIEEGSYPATSYLNTEEELIKSLANVSDEQVYTVEQGDTFNDIALQNDLTVEELELVNQGYTEKTLLSPGMILNVSKPSFSISVAEYYETSENEVVKYATEYEDDDDLALGQEKIIQKGTDGIREVTYLHKNINGEEEYKIVGNYNVIEDPTIEIIAEGTKVIPDVGTGDFQSPEPSGILTCSYGCYSGHQAIDIQSGSGSPIYAADNGRVVKNTFEAGGYGYYVIIDHNNGYQTVYGHMQKASTLSVGETVEQGEIIGYEGQTGLATGSHVHFEIRDHGVKVDPLPYIY